MKESKNHLAPFFLVISFRNTLFLARFDGKDLISKWRGNKHWYVEPFSLISTSAVDPHCYIHSCKSEANLRVLASGLLDYLLWAQQIEIFWIIPHRLVEEGLSMNPMGSAQKTKRTLDSLLQTRDFREWKLNFLVMVDLFYYLGYFHGLVHIEFTCIPGMI